MTLILGEETLSSDQWLANADSFIGGAEKIVQSQVTGSVGLAVGLLVWQGVEDSLKAVCVGHSNPHEHDFSPIINHIKSNSIMSQPELLKICNALSVVTGSATYNSTRYPENDSQYWQSKPQNELVKVTEAARLIYSICTTNIKSNKAV